MSFKKESCAGKIKSHNDTSNFVCMTEKVQYITNGFEEGTKQSLDQEYDNVNIIVGQRNKYRINERKILGRGAFSFVYSGMNLDTHDKVAIKKISLNKLTNKEIDVVDREIRTVSRLIKMSNPYKNIVTYYDVIKNDTIVYVVMEMCTDGNFSSLLVKPMKERYSRYYFKQILNGLAALQELNIVHRDIKPDNILIFDDYRTLKICDFGFSQDFKDLDFDTICGSLIYMAPESFALKFNPVSVSVNDDMYSVSIPRSLPQPIPQPIPSSRRSRSRTSTRNFLEIPRSTSQSHQQSHQQHHDIDETEKSNNDVDDGSSMHQNSDLWSAGVIFYEMVYGYHPQRGSKDIHSIRKKLSRSIRVDEMSWIDLGQDGFELMRLILEPNSISRISVNNVVKHPWIASDNLPVKKIILSEIFYTPFTEIISRSLPKTLEFENKMFRKLSLQQHSFFASVSNGFTTQDMDMHLKSTNDSETYEHK